MSYALMQRHWTIGQSQALSLQLWSSAAFTTVFVLHWGTKLWSEINQTRSRGCRYVGRVSTTRTSARSCHGRSWSCWELGSRHRPQGKWWSCRSRSAKYLLSLVPSETTNRTILLNFWHSEHADHCWCEKCNFTTEFLFRLSSECMSPDLKREVILVRFTGYYPAAPPILMGHCVPGVALGKSHPRAASSSLVKGYISDWFQT